MTTPSSDENWPDPSYGRIAERATSLQDGAKTINTRLMSLNETIQRLREGLQEVRAIAQRPLPVKSVRRPQPQAAPQTQDSAAAPADAGLPGIESLVSGLPPLSAQAPMTGFEKMVINAAAEPPVLEPPPPAEPLAEATVHSDAAAWERSNDETVVWEPPIAAPIVSESAFATQPVPSPVVVPPVVAMSSPTPRSPALGAVTYFCLLAAVLFIAYLSLTKRVAPTKSEARKAAVPARAPVEVFGQESEALKLVQQWRMAGDDLSVFARLGSVSEHPGGLRAWTTEKVDEGSFLVLYREPAGTPVYAFEVDLNTRKVHPTQEAVDRLTIMRVRDEATRKLSSMPDSN